MMLTERTGCTWWSARLYVTVRANSRTYSYTLDVLLIFRFHGGYQAGCFVEVSRLAANRQASASSANQLTSKRRTTNRHRRIRPVSGIVPAYPARKGGLRRKLREGNQGRIFVDHDIPRLKGAGQVGRFGRQ